MSANEALNALSTTDANNTPDGGDAVGTTLDDELRSIKANIARAARYEATATVAAAATVAVTALNKVVPVEGSAGGAVTVTLPTVAAAGNGFQLNFFKLGSVNDVIVDGNGAETINGASGLTISGSGQIVQLVCDGVSWYENVTPAATIYYANDDSSLTASNVQAAIDLLAEEVDTLQADVTSAGAIVRPYVFASVEHTSASATGTIVISSLPANCDFDVHVAAKGSAQSYTKMVVSNDGGSNYNDTTNDTSVFLNTQSSGGSATANPVGTWDATSSGWFLNFNTTDSATAGGGVGLCKLRHSELVNGTAIDTVRGFSEASYFAASGSQFFETQLAIMPEHTSGGIDTLKFTRSSGTFLGISIQVIAIPRALV